MFNGNVEMQKPGFVFGFLKRKLPENLVEELQGLTITKDGMSAVFDVPSEHVKVSPSSNESINEQYTVIVLMITVPWELTHETIHINIKLHLGPKHALKNSFN